MCSLGGINEFSNFAKHFIGLHRKRGTGIGEDDAPSQTHSVMLSLPGNKSTRLDQEEMISK